MRNAIYPESASFDSQPEGSESKPPARTFDSGNPYGIRVLRTLPRWHSPCSGRGRWNDALLGFGAAFSGRPGPSPGGPHVRHRPVPGPEPPPI